MTQRDPSTYTAYDLQNPNLSPTELGQIAAARQDLWPAILVHPQCYPELSQYIRQHSPQQLQSFSPYASPVAPAAGQWEGQVQQFQTPSSPAGYPAPDPNPNAYAAPGVNPAAYPAAGGYAGGAGYPGGYGGVAPMYAPYPLAKPVKTANWPSRMLLISAIVAAVSVFLPQFSVFGRSYSYFSTELEDFNDGHLVLGMSVATILLIAILLSTRSKGVRIAAGVVGILTALYGFAASGGISKDVEELGIADTEIGVGILAIASILILISAICNLVYTPRDPNATPGY